MKIKYFGVIVGVLSLLLLTGCGSKNQLKCTAEAEQNGKKYKGEIVVDLDNNDKVKDASMTMTFDSSEEADQMYSMFQLVIGMAQGMAEDGKEVPNFDIKKDGKSIIISNYASFASFSGDEEKEELLGMSKEDFIKRVESDTSNGKWTCK